MVVRERGSGQGKGGDLAKRPPLPGADSASNGRSGEGLHKDVTIVVCKKKKRLLKSIITDFRLFKSPVKLFVLNTSERPFRNFSLVSEMVFHSLR
jgi:hypothetical protein